MSRARIYMHLKMLKYALKYALKTVEICTKNVKYAKICTKKYFNFEEILDRFCKVLVTYNEKSLELLEVQ